MENKNNSCFRAGGNKNNLQMSDVRPARSGNRSGMGREAARPVLRSQGYGRPAGRISFGDIRRPDPVGAHPASSLRYPAEEKKGLPERLTASDGVVNINIKKIPGPSLVRTEVSEPRRSSAIHIGGPRIGLSGQSGFYGGAGMENGRSEKIFLGGPRWDGRLKITETRDPSGFPKGSSARRYKKILFSFAGTAAVVLVVVLGVGFFNKGLGIKNSVLGIGQGAYADLAMAKDGMAGRDFQKSSFEFGEAYDKFGKISQDINSLGGILVETSRFIPFLSKISSGDHIARAGKDISRIGILSGEIMRSMDAIKNPLGSEAGSAVSFLEIFQDADKNLKEIAELTRDVQENLDKVNIDDIPEDQRARFVELKGQLPEMNAFLAEFIDNSQIFTDVLGGNGPRKYLFLFQNNQEMRATGGFIGTYGVLDIFNGNVRRFFIDGIYNPDGQLREKVIPPSPIQKISAAWSLHDSNWFPDFPKSAEKAAWFYEKTGGPTVDGVITMTPTVMQKMLEITGPIELPEYGVTVDKDNFIEKIQYEVEVDYDKELNKPKQILADLAPKILDKLFNVRNFSDIVRTMNVLSESLDEKQILIYSKNYEIEKVLSKQGWSGEILDTQKDYVSVVNTNINGYKTDGVVDEKIEHRAEIQPDGSVIDTLTVTRHHNGGNLEHEWWNKVNADYMRVYVPQGSVLLSAEGQTREYDSPPLDYAALAFKKDPQVRMEEDSLEIDEESGTRIYTDSGKTVFANWTYVSPQETVTIKYRYLLPFKLVMDGKNKPADVYSLLAQKQSGSLGSAFVSEITYPDGYKMIWNYPEKVARTNNGIKAEMDLKSDKFIGAAFLPW